MTPIFTGNKFGFSISGSQAVVRGPLITETTTYTYTSSSVISASPPGWASSSQKVSARFYLQGAGGGTGNSTPTPVPASQGGTGGFVDYTHTSNLQTTYKLVIGQAGQPNSGGTSWGGGGDGGNMTDRGQLGGGGGGGTFVFYEPVTSFTSTSSNHSSIIACAGGGGGTFFSSSHTGGKGGTSIGQDGQRGTNPSYDGKGGTQSAAGAGGLNYGSPQASPGTNHQGGSCNQSGYEYGGGAGGGGYYGGGAGGSCVSVCPGPEAGSGGGGSSYYKSSEGTLNSWSQGVDTFHPKYDESYGKVTTPGKITIEWSYYS
jgi:hypothetical protein